MRYYLNRLGRALLTVWAAATVTFVLIRLMPGGPITQLRGQLAQQGYSAQQIERRLAAAKSRMNLNPDASIPQQYVEYMLSLAQGDLGTTINPKYMTGEGPRTVASLVAERLPWTVFVMTTATILIFAIAIVWGAIVAYSEGSRFDKGSSVLGILLGSVPFYVMAFALIIVFAYGVNLSVFGVNVGQYLDLFPARNRMTQRLLGPERGTLEFLLEVLHHAALPIASVVIVQAGLQMLAMRANSIQVLGEDYVRVARLRGLPDRRISTRYVARNAVLPMYTGFLTLIGFNIGGSVILEQVFQYRGIGLLMFNSIELRAYPVLMGVFLVFTVTVVVAILIADLTYSRIDPRVTTGESSEAY